MLKAFKHAVAATIALSALSASAALTYRVDSSTQHIIFNGSWEGGIPTLSLSDGGTHTEGAVYVSWQIINAGTEYATSTANPLSGSLTESEGTTNNSLIYFAASGPQNIGSGNNINLLFDIIFTEHSGTPGTLTLDNLTFSYALFRQDMKAYINSLPTEQYSMVLQQGSGYGEISYAIPEPAHVGLALGCLAAFTLIRRRIKKVA